MPPHRKAKLCAHDASITRHRVRFRSAGQPLAARPVTELTTVKVHYACRGCGLLSRLLTVPAKPKDLGMIAWMRQLQRMMQVDHHRICPHCRGTQLLSLNT
jgi:hypothetical protein